MTAEQLQVTQRDWQVGAGQDFIQLEPWAAACDKINAPSLDTQI